MLQAFVAGRKHDESRSIAQALVSPVACLSKVNNMAASQ